MRTKKRYISVLVLLAGLAMLAGPVAVAWAAYVNNGDGTVTDSATGLMWQQADDGVGRSWQDALSYCEALELAGKTDWRLPDIRELQSIVDDWRSYSLAINPVFSCRSSYYWSGSTLAYYPDGAWYVHFYNGYSGFHGCHKSNSSYVRCVRGGPSGYQNQPPAAPGLSSPLNGATGVDPASIVLTWQPSVDPDGDSIEYCVTVNEDGTPDDIPIFTGCDNNIFTADTSLTLPDLLEPGKTYWWAAWAKDTNDNWSPASEWWSFRTALINNPPSPPLLISPVNNASNVDPNYTEFSSQQSTDPENDPIKYCITVKEDGKSEAIFTGCDEEIFDYVIFLDQIVRYTLPISLQTGKKYWWAAWAKDENWSEASEWWSFTTNGQDMGTDTDGDGIPDSFEENGICIDADSQNN